MATVKPVLHGKAVGAGAKGKGLVFERYFTDGKVSPFDKVEWEKRTAHIGNEKGVTIFKQENVEVPKSWSQTATNIVTSVKIMARRADPRASGINSKAKRNP